ncbi:DUF6338 family protein [Luteibacter sp. dw_328]|uniref:DUF6338 family protein n=1 Tax=Luteibacter sp. dw_328 TaxID=2719796 RepID=UPI001BD279D7|nr:DUF6338 family protein [Luteibacter sp. dw_328]
MPEISTEVVALLQYLAPGFLVTWVYFGLTPHEKPSQFERTVQALIYTAVVQPLVALENLLAMRVGEWHAFGYWTANSHMFAGALTALGLGLFVATITNHDLVPGALRKHNVTTRTSHPCEWFTIFSDYSQFVVLHLRDKSTVYGWPVIWPSNAEKGHFLVTDATRKLPGTAGNISHSYAMVINVADVALVEFATPKENDSE